jgi:hypothetical protein
MSNGTGMYFMNLPKFGESGGQILPQNLPIGTGTTGSNYESTGTTAPSPNYSFSFLGGKKKRKMTKKRRIRKARKTRKRNK